MTKLSWSDWLPSIPEPLSKLLGWAALIAFVIGLLKKLRYVEVILPTLRIISILAITFVGIFTGSKRIMKFGMIHMVKSFIESVQNEPRIMEDILSAISKFRRAHVRPIFDIWQAEGTI